jgi:putative hemolysin
VTEQLLVTAGLALGCVLISAFFSGSEVALFSLRRLDRDQLARSGRPGDARILKMLGDPRRLTATVLIGNEAVNSLLAVLALGLVGALWPGQSPWAHIGIALGATLPLVVLFGEVTPKTLAAKGPIAWARRAASPLALFAVVATPVRMVLHVLTEAVLRPLGPKARMRRTHDLSEAEFKHLVDAGSAQGQVDARERRLIHRVFEFSDKNVGQCMTPRERIFALSYDLPTSRLTREVAGRGFSRVPIYQRSLDNIRGVLNAKDLLRTVAQPGRPVGPLGDLLHEPLFVPRTTPVKRLFLTFKQKKVHMAIVVNEYGKVLGIVTMDDLLAQIFGVLRDERAALQARRGKARTPATGVAVQIDTGPVPRIEPDYTPQPSEPVEPGPAVEFSALAPLPPSDLSPPPEPSGEDDRS